jgi:SAM-dependent MidA family methyltransferase
MSLLKQRILEKIHAEGPISFETFMDVALYCPGIGYYAKADTQIGRSGDFYTSPHLHPVFGAMLGRQMEEMWDLMGRPDRFRIVEMGAGMGYLALDMLAYLKARSRVQKGKKGALFEHISYSIIELNPTIKVRQQVLLKDYSERVEWHSGAHELTPGAGCFISNELLDAFPVRMVEMEKELTEVYVASKGGELVEVKRACGDDIKEYFREFAVELPEGYRTEVNLRLKDWVGDISGLLPEGFVLTIDYGYPAWDYYREERNRGTLLCYYQHELNEDPYLNVGEQDLTAHVNFSALKKWGEEFGLKTVGFCPQGTYLISLGIDEVMTGLYGDSPDAFETAKIKNLILPQGMGESHKVMVQYKGEREPKLRGFSLRNQVGKL